MTVNITITMNFNPNNSARIDSRPSTWKQERKRKNQTRCSKRFKSIESEDEEYGEFFYLHRI